LGTRVGNCNQQPSANLFTLIAPWLISSALASVTQMHWEKNVEELNTTLKNSTKKIKYPFWKVLETLSTKREYHAFIYLEYANNYFFSHRY